MKIYKIFNFTKICLLERYDALYPTKVDISIKIIEETEKAIKTTE